jgi:hypothetical protein
MGTTKFIIYCHTHIDSGRRYIGLTKKTMMRRWNQHVYSAIRRPKGKKSYFWAAIRKFGKDAFSHEVLEVCETLEAANLAESKWINHFDSRNPEKGFNLAPGGTHIPHDVDNTYRSDPEYLESQRLSAEERWEDPDYRTKTLSATQAAITTPEVRQKLSDSIKELWQNPDYREKSISKLQEVSARPEVREKLRSKWNNPDFRERCSIGTRARNEAEHIKTHCKNGHEYTLNTTAVGKNGGRECKICNYARKKAAKMCCPKGHEYSTENTHTDVRGRRICRICLTASKMITPCGKCGQPKTMKTGGRMRCKSCTTNRINVWKKAQISSTVGIV